MKKRMPKLALHRETVVALDSTTVKQAVGGLTNDPANPGCGHYVSAGGACTTTKVD